MLSMFKDKKGFSVLFRDAEKDISAAPRPTDGSARVSSRVSGTVARPTGGSGVAQLQCQRCSKRFSCLEDGSADSDAQSCCRRCGYPTCPQCREEAAGSPPWVCCVCDGYKSFMWLLEKTKAGPLLVTKIVEYCDPRGQRLMRSMFRFTLQQYRAVSSPRPSLTIAAAAAGGRVSGGASTSARPTVSQTPPAAPTSKSRTSGRNSGEQPTTGGAGLSAVSSNHSNVRKPSPYSHPKHGSLLRSVGRLSGTPTTAGGGGDGKENAVQASESPKRQHGSELLRRDDAVAVLEYSPEPNRQVLVVANGDGQSAELGPRDLLADSPTQPAADVSLSQLSLSAQERPEDRCTAVQDIYRASDTTVPRSNNTQWSSPAGEEAAPAPSPHVRPSGHAAFQREAVPVPSPAVSANANGGAVTPVERNTAAQTQQPGLSATVMTSVTPPGQPCRLGRSLSRDSDNSGRSESPAPRFPSFAQFLDDQAAVGAGQTHLPRESDVLVTVSSDSSEDEAELRDSNVMELGNARGSRLTVKSANNTLNANSNTNRTGGLRTPRGTQPVGTPPSHTQSSSRRHGQRNSDAGNEFTPTRMLDLSDGRATIRHGSSSRRRTTRGSLLEMHAPHLYGNTASGNGGGAGRRSGQMGDSPFMYDLPSHFSSAGNKRVASARGQVRRQHAPLATRTAGRPLGGAGAGPHSSNSNAVVGARLIRQNSRNTPTPLQRTASRNNALQRVPSGQCTALTRTHSSTAQFARNNSSTGRGAGFGRMNSNSAHLVRTPSSRTHLAGANASPNSSRAHPQPQPLQRTESAKLFRTASANNGLAHAHGGAALERTYSRGGLAGQASPLKRTNSHTQLGGGASPFCRFNSANAAFTRSATATAAFTRTHSAAVVARGSGGKAQHPPRNNPSSTFARTATGTYLSSGAGRSRTVGVASRAPAAGTAVSRSAYPYRRADVSNNSGSIDNLSGGRLLSARKKTPSSRPGVASPLKRTNTGTRHLATGTAAGNGRPPTPPGFTRTPTGSRVFERQASHPLRQQPTIAATAAAPRRVVDPAPALVGVTRRKTPMGAAAAGGGTTAGLRRTPSAMARTNSTATPRTPRPYIISSVSTANTPAVPHSSSGAHGGARPVLSSGTSSPKTRSTRDSLTSGGSGNATTRTSGGGPAQMSPVSTPVVKPPSGVALVGRTSAPRRRPAASAAGSEDGGSVKGSTFTRLGTGSRSAAAPPAGTRTRTGSARPLGGFVRLNSRPAAM